MKRESKRKQWLKQRRELITASDVVAILVPCECLRKSPADIYIEKCVTPERFTGESDET
jgi:predicted phage-related endonuclease